MISTRDAKELRKVDLPNNAGTVTILQQPDGRVFIKRWAARGKVVNTVDRYEVPNGDIMMSKQIDEKIANTFVDALLAGVPWSDCFIIGIAGEGTVKLPPIEWTRSPEEHRYTSTGVKFWRHKSAMESYRAGTGRSVISTHISPEGSCNLRCGYCSVTYRDTHSRIEYSRIQQYVRDLQTRGLKAVILTGGGEPTLYPMFNELVIWLKRRGLSVALITNGTTANKVDRETWGCFSWVRVSINVFDGWQDRIHIPYRELDPSCVVGCSFVYTVEHEAVKEEVPLSRIDLFKQVGVVAGKCNAKYIRVLPNCLLEQDRLIQEHHALKADLVSLGDPRFFQQYKIHGAPKCSKCHQSYYRPYLSEEPYWETGEPGSVYPCDSVVLNNSDAHFATRYQLCSPDKVLDYMDGKIEQRFDAQTACTGCVFTGTVNMLDDWAVSGEGVFTDEALMHEEFV